MHCRLACESLESIRPDVALPVIYSVFKDFGLPRAIRTDNGAPFATPYAVFSLSKLATFSFPPQHERLDFTRVYDDEGRHQALSGACPGDVHTSSVRVYEPPADPEDPYHDRTTGITRCGWIGFDSPKITFRNVFASQPVDVRKSDNQIWQASLMQNDLGFFDKEKDRVEPHPNLFTPDKV